MKIAGRDANKFCVVVKVIDNRFVMIDGQTRRKKVNVSHIEPLNKVVKVSEEADSEEVNKALAHAGFKVVAKKARTKAKSKPVAKPTVKKVKKVKA